MKKKIKKATGEARAAKAKIKRVVEELFVVCTDVDGDWQCFVWENPSRRHV